jgi:hypothetical protein
MKTKTNHGAAIDLPEPPPPQPFRYIIAKRYSDFRKWCRTNGVIASPKVKHVSSHLQAAGLPRTTVFEMGCNDPESIEIAKWLFLRGFTVKGLEVKPPVDEPRCTCSVHPDYCLVHAS